MSLHIPNIDISAGLNSPAIIDQLTHACEDWGFFQISGHGIDTRLQQQFFAAINAFFALPSASKLALSRSGENFWGYYDKELTKNKLDQKEIYDIDANLEHLTAARPALPMPWPQELPELRPTSIKWMLACEQLSLKLLRAICVAMGETATALDPFFIQNHSSFLRFNYYPTGNDNAVANHDDADALGIYPHTDAGALAVLAQDQVPGLQVKKDDTWHTVLPVANSFIINIGDMIQVWSNDRFKAPLHRVLASSKKARVSAPYFFNPSYETVCTPLLKADEPSHYTAISWSEFRKSRAAGDYADQGEEIQISWYRQSRS
jgi:isopenicillin N synthase-like dioxygenase